MVLCRTMNAKVLGTIPGIRLMSCTIPKPRVVITGMGVVSCLGVGSHLVWERLINGDCGIIKLTDSDYEKIPCKIAGVVPKGEAPGQLNIAKFVTKSEQRVMSMASCYALAAAEEALNMAGWFPKSEPEKCSTGVAIGSGMVDLPLIVKTGSKFYNQGYSKLHPLFIPQILLNMSAGHVSIKYGFKGPSHSVSTACTTGLHAICDAFKFIQNGDAQVMLCGGTEASVEPLSIGGFSRMRALCTSYNDNPCEASRPFDNEREGFVMGEGAGILILENLDHALHRNANIYGEILGYGLSSDAHHITTPPADGDGAFRCMQAALKKCEIEPHDVGYINAHATSTPLGDAAELRAIQNLFKDYSSKVSISSCKGAIGHLLGAAGAVETILTVMACHSGKIPYTLNFKCSDPEFKMNIISKEKSDWNISTSRIALKNSFGFGGTNASVCISSFH